MGTQTPDEHWELTIGDPCPVPGCFGEMIRHDDTPCQCPHSPMPPCSGCEGMRVECSDCYWEPGENIEDFKPSPESPRPAIEGSW